MVALENSSLSIFERREILLDISELLLKAQQEGRSVDSVIEKDVHGFVDRIKLSYGYRNSIIFNILIGIQYFIYALVIVQGAVYLMRSTDTFFETTIGLMILPEMFILSFLLIPLLRYFISHQKILWFILTLLGFVFLFLGSTVLLRRFGGDISWVQTYLDKEINIISSWLIIIILAIIMVSIWLIKWFIRKWSIKKIKAAW
jgi:hypothetical protein